MKGNGVVSMRLGRLLMSNVMALSLAGVADSLTHAEDTAGAPLPREQPVEITVRALSKVERIRQSAESVRVVETEAAQRESADLGAVLARTQGVGVRRAGGLGSETRFSLNGLTDDQVRFFLDGVPLALAGYPFGVSNVPVNLIERAEIFSGVVPIRFGADALGGAVNLVSEEGARARRVAASYELGSFETQRLTLAGKYLHASSGLYARATGFVDDARNDYPIDAEVSDAAGRVTQSRVHRFHDAYGARGGSLELGVIGRPWAKRLVLRTYLTDYDKEFQSNVSGKVPYGAAQYGETASGASLRYEQRVSSLSLSLVGGYAYARGHLRDATTCFYDWSGRCVAEGPLHGEIQPRPRDALSFQHAGFARAWAAWEVGPAHTVRVSAAPTYVTRSGDERVWSDPSRRDPLSGERSLLTIVSGLEHQLTLLDERLENVLFVKHYLQQLASEDADKNFQRSDRTLRRVGAGDSLRYRFSEWLHAKASYEWATRLPSPDEVFGNSGFILPNLGLDPETSHNANLGLTLALDETAGGAWDVTASGFLRDADHLIALLGTGQAQRWENVLHARSLGVEGALRWSAPGALLTLVGSGTYLDFRNQSASGTFPRGDRIPNRPYLFASGSARGQLRDLFAARDALSLTWTLRYVHGFPRNWESLGNLGPKETIPSQIVHGVALGYLAQSERASLTTTAEVQNLTDEKTFDLFGAQRPGRAFFLKTTAEF